MELNEQSHQHRQLESVERRDSAYTGFVDPVEAALGSRLWNEINFAVQLHKLFATEQGLCSSK